MRLEQESATEDYISNFWLTLFFPQLLNRDFYHLSAGTLEVKSNTPNNVAFKVTGKNSHEKTTNGTVSYFAPQPEAFHDFTGVSKASAGSGGKGAVRKGSNGWSRYAPCREDRVEEREAGMPNERVRFL